MSSEEWECSNCGSNDPGHPENDSEVCDECWKLALSGYGIGPSENLPGMLARTWPRDQASLDELERRRKEK